MSAAEQTEKIDNATPTDNPNNNNNEVNQNTNKNEVSDVSPSSGVSSASSKSTTSKQSGIRPPSRIGRPCGGIHKPAIPPATPTKNSSDDSIRRLTDDFGRHKLSDLMEADESEEDGLDYYLKSSAGRNRYTSLGSTASSMDGLWELHPRRLSEAGLSRHSDSSAVLTEDTDSFIIGQRVWVGGSKPGTIAYIGETQFAPGEWAGIALDEPIGKNDGSVGGIKYFQCESKKGVFSRLTRLTRVPLEQPGMGSNETFVTSNNGVRRSPISPTGSTKGLLQSAASLSISNTSLSSTATHVDFKLGDRVIIKSTQGSKIGTVRYMGLADFAPGEWVGVELDDPRGKNDGSVEGKRYFECRPNFGLFAPVSKVSKSPSKYKPSACVVHSGPGLPPSGLRRANSKESMTSMVSKASAASSVRRVRLGVTSLTPKKVTPKTTTPIPTRTALQDVLREKQLHIEQLLKERDLERAEITRAASQADDAEHKLLTLTQEFEKYRAECEIKVRENHEFLNTLKVDREKLLNQLEDERRRNEDLQFRFEEASITKSDIEAASENYVKRIGQLESNLTEERHKSESLEQTSNKLFEAEESLIKAREEIDVLKHDLEATGNARATMEEKHTASAQLAEALQQQVERAGVDHEEQKKTINKLNEEISKVKTEHEAVKREVEDNCKEKDSVIAQLRLELENQKNTIEQYEKKHSELLKENEKLKMELSAKSLDAETGNEQISARDGEIRTIRDTLEQVKKELSHKTDDLELHKSNSQKVERDLRTELEQTRENLKTKISEVENVKKDYGIQLSQREQQLQESNQTVAQSGEEIKKLTDELDQVKNNFEESKKETHERHGRQIVLQDSQLMALSAELQQKSEELTKAAIVISKLEEDLCTKNGAIEMLGLEMESYKDRFASQNETSVTFTQRINELTLANGDFERLLANANNHIAELTQIRQRQDLEIQQLSVKCEGAVQLEQLRNEIVVKEQALVAVRQEYETKIQNLERSRQEVQLNHADQLTGIERVKHELEAKLQMISQSEMSLQQRCENNIAELSRVRDEYRIQINELQTALHEKELMFNNHHQKNSEAARMQQEELNSVTEELNRQLQGCQQRISGLTDENLQIKQQLVERNELLIETKAEASHSVAQFQQTEQELNQKCADTVRQIEFELNEKSLQLQQTVTELQLLKNDCQNTNIDLSGKDRQISELTTEIHQAQTLITQQQQELNSVRVMYEQNNKEQGIVQNQCHGLLEQVASLTEQVRNGEQVFKILQVEHNNAMLLVKQLRITEQQKQQCLQQLQHETAVISEKLNCQSVTDLLNKMNIDNNTENTEKIFSLQRDLEIIRSQLAERNHQYDSQQSELLRLQQELLKAEEINSRCASGPQDANSVRFDTTQHNTQHATFISLNPLELQIQLVTLKNSFSKLLNSFNALSNDNMYLYAQLRNAINSGHRGLIPLQRHLSQNIQNYQSVKHKIQVDNFNLQKVVQYSILQLQEKNRVLNHQNVAIQKLQQILRNLPLQCKSFTLVQPNFVSNACSDVVVDNKKIADLLQVKNFQIVELRKQISTLLSDWTGRSESRICIQKHCLCAKSQIVPGPTRIVRLVVPVIQPQVVVKQVLVPIGPGRQCPVPTVQRIEIPRVIIQKVPFPVPYAAQCRLPDLTTLYGGNAEQTIDNLDLSSYNSPEVLRFKQTLLSLIGHQRSCLASSTICTDLPRFNIPDRCVGSVNIINNLVLRVNKHNLADVNAFKQSLSQLLNYVQSCSSRVEITELQHIIQEQTSEINVLKQKCWGIRGLPSFKGAGPHNIINNVIVPGNNDVNSYKQRPLQHLNYLQGCSSGVEITNLQQIIQQLKSEINTLKQRCSGSWGLPSFNIPDRCAGPSNIINKVIVPGNNDVNSYKRSLLQLLNYVRGCSSGVEVTNLEQIIQQQTSHINILKQRCSGLWRFGQNPPQLLPVLNTPNGCPSLKEYVTKLPLSSEYDSSQVSLYKNSLLRLLAHFQTCPLSIGSNRGCDHAPLPNLPALEDCVAPSDIINRLKLESFSEVHSNLFRQTLLQLLLLQRECAVTEAVKIVQRSLYGRVPVEVPKIIRVPQPPRIIFRQVPILQAPRIVIKPVLVPVPQAPRIFRVPVPQGKDCTLTVQQVPIKIPVIVRVPVPVPIGGSCRLPNLNIFDCSSPLVALRNIDVSGYNVAEANSFKESLLNLINMQRQCNFGGSPQVIRIPVPVYPHGNQVIQVPQACGCNLPNLSLLAGCIVPGMIESLVIPGACSQADIISFKQTLWNIAESQKSCSVQSIRDIIRQVPVFVPRTVVKEIVKEVLREVTRLVRIPVDQRIGTTVPVPAEKIGIKEIKVPFYQRVPFPVVVPREVIRRVVVKVPVPVPHIVKVPIIQTHEGRVPVPVPHIIQVPKEVIREVVRLVKVPVRVPVPGPVRILIKKIPIMQPRRIIFKQIPSVNYNVERPPRIVQVPVPIPSPPRIIVKPVPVQVPVRVKIPVPITQTCYLPLLNLNTCEDLGNIQYQIDSLVLSGYDQADVNRFKQRLFDTYVLQRNCYLQGQCRSRIVQVPRNVYRPKEVVRVVKVPIYQKVPVFVPIPHNVRYPVRQIPYGIPEPKQYHLPNLNLGDCHNLQAEIKGLQIQGFDSWEVQKFKQDLFVSFLRMKDCVAQNYGSLPSLSQCRPIIKQVPVSVQVPLRVPVIVRGPCKPGEEEGGDIYGPNLRKENVLVPVKVPFRVPVPIHIPQVDIRVVRIPVRVPVVVQVPSPPQVIIKQVPVPVRQPPRLIFKPILIKGGAGLNRIIFKDKIVRVPSPPQIILRQIPVRVTVPVKVPVPVQVPLEVPVPVKVPTIIRVPVPVGNRNGIESSNAPIYVKVPVPVPRVVNKIVQIPVRVPVQVPIPQQPRIIVKQIPVYIPAQPRIVYKPIYLGPGRHDVNHIQFVRLPPRVIVQQVAVRIPVPTKVPYAVNVPVRVPVEVPVRIRVPVPVEAPKIQIREVRVPVRIPVPVEVPRIQIREVRVPVQVPVHVRVPVQVPVEVPRIQIQQVRIPIRIPVPVQVPVEVPKIQIRDIRVPVNMPYPVRIPLPPKILFKHSPVPIPQRPEVIIKQVPIIIAKCDQKPKIIVKEKAVPIIVSRPVIKQVPVYVKVQVPVRVPVRLPVEFPVPIVQIRKVRVPLRVPVPVQVPVEIPKIHIREIRVPFKVPIYVKVRVPGPIEIPRERIREVRIPVRIPVPVQIPVQVPVEVPRVHIREIKVPVPVQVPVEVPRIHIRELRVPVRMPVQVPVVVPRIQIRQIRVPIQVPYPVRVPLPARILFKQVPVLIPQRPEVVIKQVPIFISGGGQRPRIILREKPVPVIVSRPVIKQVPVYVKVSVPIQVPIRVPVQVPVEVPTVQIREVRVPTHIPVSVPGPIEVPKIQIREVRVPVRIPVPVQVPIHVPVVVPRIQIREVRVPVEVRRIQIREVRIPVRVPVEVPRLQIREVRIPVRIPVPVQVPVEVPKIQIREVRVPVNVPYPVRVPLPPQILLKQVPILVPQRRPEVIIKQIPIVISKCNQKPRIIVREKLVPQFVQRPVIKEVPVRIRVPVEVPVQVRVKVPVRVPVEVPRIKIREVRVPVRIPVPVQVPVVIPRVQIREVRVPVRIPTPVKVPEELPGIQMGKALVQVPLPPRILIKQVPILVPQRPQLIVKQVPIFLSKSNPQPRLIVREKPVPVIVPRIIVKQIPVNVCHARLPKLSAIGDGINLQAAIEGLGIEGFDQWQVQKFKQELLALLSRQQNCYAGSRSILKVPVKVPVIVRVPVQVPIPVNVQCHLPNINLGDCRNVQAEIDALQVQGVDLWEVQKFKYGLFASFLRLKDCVIGSTNIPHCPPIRQVKIPVPVQVPFRVPIFVKVPSVRRPEEGSDIDNPGIKRIMVPVPVRIPSRLPVPMPVPVPVDTQCRLPVIHISNYADIRSQIKNWQIPGYSAWEADRFKHNLLDTLMGQKNYEMHNNGWGASRVIRVPVDRIVEVPKVDIRVVKVPVKVPVVVQVPLPQQIIIKQVPVPVPQAPKVIIKPLFVPGGGGSNNGIILKDRIVRIPSAPQIIIKQVPVKVPVIVRVPVQVPIPVNVQCHLPNINLGDCRNVQAEIDALQVQGVDLWEVQRFKHGLFASFLRLKDCVIGSTNIPHCPPIRQVKIPVPVQVPFRVPIFVKVPSVRRAEEGSDIDNPGIKRIMVPVPVRIPSRLPVPMPVPVPVDTQCRLPVIHISNYADIRSQIKNWQIPGYSAWEADRFKHNLLDTLMGQRNYEMHNNGWGASRVIRVPVDRIVEVPKVDIRVVKVPVKVPVVVQVPLPQQIIIKQVPVPVPQAPKVIIKPLFVPGGGGSNNGIILKDRIVRIPSAPQIIIKQVPVRVTVPVKVPIPVQVPVEVRVPMKVPVIVHVPVPIGKGDGRQQCYLPDLNVNGCGQLQEQIGSLHLPGYNPYQALEFKQNLLSLLLQQRDCVLQRSSGSLVVEKPVYIRQSPVIVYQKVPVNICVNDSRNVGIISKQVPVYIRVPVPVHGHRIVEKAVPLRIIQQVPIPLPPQIIEKHVPIRIPTPPKIIVHEVKVPILHGVACPAPRVEIQRVPVLQPPQILTRPVMVRVITPLVKQISVPYPVPVGPKVHSGSSVFAQTQLQQRLNYYASQLCNYRKLSNRLRHVLRRALVALRTRFDSSRFASISKAAVPLPMLHVMKSFTPNLPLIPVQLPSSSIGFNSEAFVIHLHQAYKKTQEALSHCMDAVLAQTLSVSQLKSKCSHPQQLVQDRELADNQIRFLNSIIVDIQKKNEEQRARIEILEAGGTPDFADDLRLIGSGTRQFPPRMYCDICEEFDLHETEDCPKQGSEEVPLNGQRERRNVADRPYCEICEEFGHATEDCKEDQTF